MVLFAYCEVTDLKCFSLIDFSLAFMFSEYALCLLSFSFFFLLRQLNLFIQFIVFLGDVNEDGGVTVGNRIFQGSSTIQLVLSFLPDPIHYQMIRNNVRTVRNPVHIVYSIYQRSAIQALACSSLPDGREREKNPRSCFRFPDYLGAWNRLSKHGLPSQQQEI